MHEDENIQLFAPVFDTEACLEQIRECFEKGWTGLGYKTVAFEEAWKQYASMAHAHFLNSSTGGLHLALRVLKIRHEWEDGDEVITTPLTFVSSNHAILYENLQPVFADVDSSLCLDPASVEARITGRTRAVMYVGMGGNAANYGALRELCLRRGLSFVVDGAHMAGSRLEGRQVGYEADMMIFSFQAVKNLPTGDAGMICTPHAEYDRLARALSWLGINKDTYARFKGGKYRWRYDVPHIGHKYHGNSIMAAIGLAQLPKLDEGNAHRRHLAECYDSLLSDLPEVERVSHDSRCESSRHLYQILVDKRDALMEHFYAHKIFPGVHYEDNTCYPMYRFGMGNCPRATRYSQRLISLPLHLRMQESHCERVASVLRSFLN